MNIRKIFYPATLALVSLALGGLSPTASAQHGGWCSCGGFDQQPAFFEIDHDDERWRAQARQSMERWNTYANLFSYGDGDGRAGPNGKNEIVYFSTATIEELYGFRLSERTFAIAALMPQFAFGDFNECPAPSGVFCGSFSETDVLMNVDFSRGWTDAEPNYQDSGPALYLATSIHELGHTMGLHHNPTQLSTMNYIEDYAAQYLGLSDTRAARTVGPARSVLDLATYPFYYLGESYAGTTVASLDRSVVTAGQAFQLRNFTLENVGSEDAQRVRLEVYLSTDRVIDGSDHAVGNVFFESFDSWWDSTGQSFTVPTSVPAGTYFVGAAVYHQDTQLDGVGYNNSWMLDESRQLRVNAAPGGPGPGPGPGPISGNGMINMSTNTRVPANGMAAGFIVRGAAKRFVMLGENEGGMSDPTIEVTDILGNRIGTASNNNWRDWPGAAAATQALGREPRGELDALIDVTLGEGTYLAWLRDSFGTVGRGNIQINDIGGFQGDLGSGRMINMSTNSTVPFNGMAAGFIVRGQSKRFIILGENEGGMSDPIVSVTDSAGNPVTAGNDNWQDWPAASTLVSQLGRTPKNVLDAMLDVTLGEGAYLAWLRDKNGVEGRGNIQINEFAP